MKTSKYKKYQQFKHYQTVKAGWNKIAVIVEVSRASDDPQDGWDTNNNCYSHVTNFDEYVLSKYIEAVRTYPKDLHFGIAKDAWGFYEDEGLSFELPDHRALYIRDRRALSSDFWRHFDSIYDAPRGTVRGRFSKRV